LSKIILEVCVDSIFSLKEAIKGGADRIELCSSLSEGGLTPSYGFIEIAKKISPIPIFVLIRPRSGNFYYAQEEYEIILKDIAKAKELGADGIVCGFLNKQGQIDKEQTIKAVEVASPLPFTFHRAFDVSTESTKTAIGVFKQSGVKRLLTSGRKATAFEGTATIKDLVMLANDELVIMAGSGINTKNALDIISSTGVKEIHASCKTSIKNEGTNSPNIAMGTNDATDTITVTDTKKVQTLKALSSFS
jgi:copper homeostasis protein